MSDNISLAIKHRPKMFSYVVGQESITKILTHQIYSNSFKQAYLFTGSAGTGKTTTARIFASAINDKKGSPIEIDGASNNSVDDVRQIIADAKRKALDCDYKVFIIDECHALSANAWQAMLKVIEEPPVGTVFIFCTTNPEKIPATILSRVQRFNFTRIPTKTIFEQLCKVLNTENQVYKTELSYDDEAVMYIAKLADGGMRDALTMLDKCLAYDSNITMHTVTSALNVVDYGVYIDLLYSFNTYQVRSIVEILNEIYDSGKDIKNFMKQFMYFVLDVCKLKTFESYAVTNIPKIDEYDDKLADEPIDDCLQTLKFLRQLNADLKWENSPKNFIEMNVFLYCKLNNDEGEEED